jgi:hypothetical protein
MALGFDFLLASNEFARITITASPSAPASGFYLRQSDPATPSDVYLSGAISIQPSGPIIPEPGSWLLVGAGIVLGVRALRQKEASR